MPATQAKGIRDEAAISSLPSCGFDLLSGLREVAIASDAGTPQNPRLVEDFATEQRLVVTYETRGGDPNTDPIPATLRNFVIDAQAAKIPVLILTGTESAKTDLIRRGFTNDKGVTVERVQNFPGNPFARDSIPFLITTEAGGKRSFAYVIGADPNTGQPPPFVKELLDKGLLNGPLFTTPLKIEGGHLLVDTTGHAYLTDSFYERNSDRSEAQVNQLLKDFLGIDPANIVKLKNPPNSPTGHSDVLIRPLPNGTVLAIDPTSVTNAADRAALEANLTTLRATLGADKVKTVSIPPNTPALKAFGFTYVNAWIADKVAVVPSFGDPAADAAAKAAYTESLPGYRVTQVPIPRNMAMNGGCLHCLSSSLSVGSAKKKPAQAGKSPTVSFDPSTGVLRIADDAISQLLPFDPTLSVGPTDPNDPLLGAILHFDDLSLNRELSSERVFLFDGGLVTLTKDGRVVVSGELSRLYVFPSINEGLLDHFGVLFNVAIDPSFPSTFLGEFQQQVLADSRLYVDAFLTPETNLAVLSHGFTLPFTTELRAAGISGNGSLVSAPSTLLLLGIGATGMLVGWRLRRGRRFRPPARS